MKFSPAKPTQRSGILLISLIMVGAGVLRTRNNLLYLVFSILVLMFAVGWLGPSFFSRFLKVIRSIPPAGHEGTEVTCRVKLHNTSRIAETPSVVLEHTNSIGASPFTPVLAGSLAPRTEIEFELPLRLEKRGLRKLDPVTMISSFPMGLFERTWSQNDSPEILVYPRIVSLRDRFLEGVAVNLTRFTTVPDTEREVQALREFQDGDSLRRVNWKASARRDQLIVGEYHRIERKAKVVLMLDISGGGEEQSEAAISLTASLAQFYHAKKRLIRLVTQRQEITFGRSERKIKAVMKLLALLNDEDRIPLKQGLKPENSCLTVLIHSGHLPPAAHTCDIVIGPREFGTYAPELRSAAPGRRKG